MGRKINKKLRPELFRLKGLPFDRGSLNFHVCRTVPKHYFEYPPLSVLPLFEETDDRPTAWKQPRRTTYRPGNFIVLQRKEKLYIESLKAQGVLFYFTIRTRPYNNHVKLTWSRTRTHISCASPLDSQPYELSSPSFSLSHWLGGWGSLPHRRPLYSRR